MASIAVPRARFRRKDLRLVARQVRFEQLSFWRNPVGATFTIGFSTVFLILLAASGGTQRIGFLGGIRQIQYYVPGFIAYGVMAACFNTLAIALVVRREYGLLKRLRLSPLPAWVMLTGLFLSTLIVSFVQVVLLLAIGKLAYHVELPHAWGALIVALIVGAACFTALGVATSTLIPNQDAAGPVIGIAFYLLLFLSGLWYPLKSGSTLARVSAYLPVRAFLLSVFAPFDIIPGAPAWSWHNMWIMLIWGAVGLVIALRRFRWAPWRA